MDEEACAGARFLSAGDAKRPVGVSSAMSEGEAAFIERHNAEWLVERNEHGTPPEVRAKMRAAA
jgi:hypothetical protein